MATGIYNSRTRLGEDAAANTNHIIAHCFKQFKEDFCLPASRRRIIILPKRPRGPDPAGATRPPQGPPPPPVPSFKVLEAEDIQEPPEDRQSWLSHRAKLRKDLETLGDTARWLGNKPNITASEAKVLQRTQDARPRAFTFPTSRSPKKKPHKSTYRSVPQLRLPKPPCLSNLYAYLRSRKIKILELFHKVDHSENHRISREELIFTLKAVGAPLNNRELEDIVIYLSSLGKQSIITAEILSNTYKQWSLAQQRSTLPTAKEYSLLAKQRVLSKTLLTRSKVKPAPESPKMDLLTVPSVNTEKEFRPLTLEEMEDVGRRYRQRRRQHKLVIPSIDYSESCRMVRCGTKPVDEHCLPSTIVGDTTELIDVARRDTFLVYLQCWKLCEAHGLPLSEDVLMRALLYPGDKIIFQREEVRPIRQPGGFYSDWKITPSLSLPRGQDPKSGTKKQDKKTSKKIKKMKFKEFEEFARKLEKSPPDSQKTRSNCFWPGHFLDKLRLYLPAVAKDRSLAVFSCVKWERQAYPAFYHPNRWWPLRDVRYMTCAHYDANKVYYIN